MPRIFDTFTFFDELDLLEFRLAELREAVDVFVLVESNLTFTGREKPLVFAQNQDRFSVDRDRIVHVVHDAPADPSLGPWGREESQRNAILEGLAQAGARPEDYVLISDCDEVPRADLLTQIRRHGFDIFAEPANHCYRYDLGPFELDQYRFDDELFGFLQDHYYYDLECRHAGAIWWQSRILSYRRLLELGRPNDVRRLDIDTQYYARAGWHFAYFGGPRWIANKIASFSHQEYNSPEYTAEENIAGAIRERRDLYGRDEVELEHVPIGSNDDLPVNYRMLLRPDRQGSRGAHPH